MKNFIDDVPITKLEKAIQGIKPFLLPDNRGYHGNYYEWYYTYTKTFQPRRMLEIGVSEGCGAFAFLLGHPSVEYYGLDCVDPEPVMQRLRGFFPDSKIVGHHGDSLFISFPHRGLIDFDFIYVDGNHTFEYCANDMAKAWEVLNRGGVMVVDDVNMPDVLHACEVFHHDHPDVYVEKVPTLSTHLLWRKM